MKRILIPVPAYGFDPTETAIPWKMLSENKFQVFFATPEGKKAQGDELILTGKKLGVLKRLLQARLDAKAAYYEMERTDAFGSPLNYAQIKEADFDALLLPGGHDKGVREYLESNTLQQQVAQFFKMQKPVAAICHGVVLAARSIDPSTQKSVLHDYKTTALLKSQELAAYRLTRLWLKDYYLIRGPRPSGRDDFSHLNRGFTVRDRNYLSARWPGDVYNFSLEFIRMLEGK